VIIPSFVDYKTTPIEFLWPSIKAKNQMLRLVRSNAAVATPVALKYDPGEHKVQTEAPEEKNFRPEL
jgi:hypothetical protein